MFAAGFVVTQILDTAKPEPACLLLHLHHFPEIQIGLLNKAVG